MFISRLFLRFSNCARITIFAAVECLAFRHDAYYAMLLLLTVNSHWFTRFSEIFSSPHKCKTYTNSELAVKMSFKTLPILRAWIPKKRNSDSESESLALPSDSNCYVHTAALNYTYRSISDTAKIFTCLQFYHDKSKFQNFGHVFSYSKLKKKKYHFERFVCIKLDGIF